MDMRYMLCCNNMTI